VRQLAAQSLMGLALGAVAVGTIGVIASFGFDSAFNHFHRIFFSNNDWQLDPARDHLIQMFPEAFWRDMTIALGVMCVLEALVIAAVSTVYLMGSRSQRRHLAGSLEMQGSHTQAA
jgi:integral membrane protein (TIGR01906 family)